MANNNQTLRVFISSTSIDLVEYREAVIKTILSLDMMPVAMEFFNASTDNPAQLYYEKVQGVDIFVGIYARRYGFVPTPDGLYTGRIPPDDKKSMTELEYNWANERNIPILCFILNEDVDWELEHTDTGDRASRLNIFKEGIGENHTFKKFMDKGQLTTSLATALAEARTKSLTLFLNQEAAPLESLFPITPEIPKNNFEIYARLWQLENWLKQMVYVELKSAYGDDWDKYVVLSHSPKTNKDSDSFRASEPLYPISYVSVEEINNTILKEWRLFAPYLPRERKWEVTAEELSDIRTELTSFRVGHERNLQRLEEILRELDNGLWQFCASYNDTYDLLPTDSLNHFFKGVDYRPVTHDLHWTRKDVTVRKGEIGVGLYFSKRQWQLEVPENKMGAIGFVYHAIYYAMSPFRFDAQLDFAHQAA